MSSIQFDATLDSSKLESAIKQSKKTVQDWAGDVEKASGKADRSFDKMGESLKDSIKYQKEYVKGLTKEVNEMQKAFDKATAGTGKSKMGEELGQAKRRLSESTGELIGMQNEQIAVNNKEKESADSLTGAIGKWALSLGGAAMALRVVKEAVLATTTGLNAFNTVAAVSKQIMYNLVTNAQSLTSGLQGVIEAQREINRLRIQDKIDTYDAKIEMLKYNQSLIAAKDQTNSVIDRIKAYDEAIAHKKKSTDIEIQSTLAQIEAYKKILISSPDNEKAKMAYLDLRTKIIDLQINETSAMKEISSMRSGLIKKDIADEKKWREDFHNMLQKAADEQIAINNSVAEQEKLLQEAVISGTDAEIKAISARIIKLKEELALREKLTQQAIAAAITRGEPISGVNIPGAPALTSAISVSSILAPAPNAFKAESKYIEGTKMLTKNALAEIAKAKENYAKDEEDLDEKKIRNQQEILQGAIGITYQLGQQLGLSQEELNVLGGTLDAFMSMASGNFIGAAFGILSTIIGVFGQNKDIDGRALFQKQIDAWDKLLEKQKELIELSFRLGGGEAALKVQIEEYKNQLTVLRDRISQYNEDTLLNIAFRRSESYSDLVDLIDLKQKELNEAQQSLEDYLTGNITQNTIADIIARGFQEGKTSIDDFGEYMNSVLLDSVMAIFSTEILGDAMNDLQAYIVSALEDKELTQKEKENIDAQITAIAESNKELWDKLTGSLDLGGDGTHAGLTGEIRRSITEETGTELAGLFRRFADEQRVVKDYSILGVSHLVGIEANTMNTVLELQKAVVELQAINTNTKQVPVAGL